MTENRSAGVLAAVAVTEQTGISNVNTKMQTRNPSMA